VVPTPGTNEPSTIESDPSRSERTSLIVPGLNVFEICRSSSMRHLWLPRPQLAEQSWQDERPKYEHGGYKLQIARIETPPQCHRPDQTEEHPAPDRSHDRNTHRAHPHHTPTAKYAGQAPHPHH